MLLKSAGSLSQASVKNLSEFFSQVGHNPSSEMREALRDVLGCLESMALGVSEPRFYLSSVDPGVGKSTAIVAFLKALLGDPGHRDVGVLIGLSRKAEIRALIDAGLKRDQFAVLTADQELNDLGGLSPASAQVLFTTQQMIERRCFRKQFGDTEEFWFKRRPRVVRIWDESLVPGHPVVLNRDEIVSLLRYVREPYPELAERLEALHREVRELKDGDFLELPDLASTFGYDLDEASTLLKTKNEDVRDAGQKLRGLSSREVVIRDEGKRGVSLVGFYDHLPKDFAPALVLDASGRVRGTYRLWEKHRGGLVRLKIAAKRYDNLTIHHWRRGGGKRSFQQNGPVLVEGIASTINEKPDEKWLVIHHKPADGEGNLEAAIRDALTIPPDQVHFLTWGNHHATNEFAEVPNVVLAGTLFYREAVYEAYARAAGGLVPGKHDVTPEQLDDFQLAESLHMVLQALCRGSVRKADGEQCGRCDTYIIAAPNTRIGQSLTKVFPGCKVVPWEPVEQELKGKPKQAIEFIRGWFEEHPTEVLPFTTVREAIGVKHSSHFTQSIRQHEGFQKALEAIRVEECGGKTRMTGFRRRKPRASDCDF